MIIDFIGAPGAGKTTLKHTVVDYFTRRGIPANLVKKAGIEHVQHTIPGQIVNVAAPRSLRSPLLWRIFYPLSVASRVPFIFRHAELTRLVVQAQHGRPKEAYIRKRKVISRFLQMIGYYEYLTHRCAPDEVLVFDEGFIHRVILLFASEVEVPNPVLLHRYMDLIPRPDLIVYTYAPPEVCKKRILERGLWGWSHDISDERMARFVDHAILTVEMAVEYMIKMNWPLVQINNQNDGAHLAEDQLRNALEMHYHSESQSPTSIPVSLYRQR